MSEHFDFDSFALLLASCEEMREVPVLETKRLRLRGHRLEDSLAMWSDPEVTRYISTQPPSASASFRRLLIYGGHWNFMGFGYWAVEEKASERFLGEIGFADFKREIVPSIEGVPELGWVLASHAHGKGYATEALNAAIPWGDKNLSASRSVCIIDPENLASLRVAEKCGY